MCVRDFQLFQQWIVNTLSKHLCCSWNALTLFIMNLIYEQQGCTSQCDVRLMYNIRLRIFCHQMNTFIQTFMLLTERDAITSTSTHGTFFVIRPPSSSFATLSTDTHHLFVPYHIRLLNDDKTHQIQYRKISEMSVRLII